MSIAVGIIKSIVVTISTPFLAKKPGVDPPRTATIFAGHAGSTSGVSVGLAYTDIKQAP